MTRIVAGTLGGRRLTVPAGQGTRPTSDRVREALFSSLEAMIDLDGSRFADLYAGSGAVGFEACSRGAAHVLLAESDAKAARIVRGNIATLGVGAAVRLVADKVERLLQQEPCEHGALFRSARSRRPAVAHHLDRTEDAVRHRGEPTAAVGAP